ncbi:MAG: ACP synthase [Archangiaceae bacterium]|nr:ACP synthase [Archangiaceae bacterium]
MSHATELSLRKLFAGEDVGAELKAHSDACDECKAKLRAIEDEQRRFEAAIPFERFAAGVERANRTPRHVAAPPPRRAWLGYAVAIAAGLLVVAAAPLLLRDGRHPNGIKGTDAIELHIGGASGSTRKAQPNVSEPLSSGERVEITFSAQATRYLVAVSVDEAGEVASYPESGQSLPVLGKGHLPDSFEFTGHGFEHVVVVLNNEPFSVEDVRRALRARYDEARGNLTQLGRLDVSGEQLHYTFMKP